MYLPQFHSIPENDEFWGKGFTDWVTVKNAKPLYKGHCEPRVPLNSNYYDLSLKDNVKWQAELAKQYGIDGFGIYHYWFNNDKNLLTKPAEIILENRDIEISFFFAWDNCNWCRSWGNVKGNDWAPVMEQGMEKNEKKILIPYILGGESDWEKHYETLRPYFLDDRYIKKENCPIFIIFHYDDRIASMCDYWNQMAQKDGFSGMYFIFRYDAKLKIPAKDHIFRYEPHFSGWSGNQTFIEKVDKKIRKILGISTGLKKYQYDRVWANILSNTKSDERSDAYPGAFVSYDDTPRRGRKGTIIQGASPEKFKHYLSQLLDLCTKHKKEFIFLTAWNEWGEGAYLEPDEKDKYAYLDVIKELVSRSRAEDQNEGAF